MILKKYLVLAILFLSFLFSGCSSQSLEADETKAYKPMTCLFFFIPDCPASRACMTPIMKLKDTYEKNGLTVIGVLSDPEPDDSTLQRALQENKIDFEIRNDSSLEIARQYHATTTPQFFLLDSLGSTIYSGLIDNYYYGFGRHRVAATENYLEDAILAHLNGEKMNTLTTKPIGCKINFD